jgi:hypothetical protein
VSDLLEPSLVEKVKKNIDDLNRMCAFYAATKQEYTASLEERKALEIESKEVEEKQKKQDKFLEVVLLAEHKSTELDAVHKKLQQTIDQLGKLSETLNAARTDILRKLKDLPFPVDPHNSSVEGSVTKFKMIEGIAFERETLRTLCELLESPYPLNLEGVTYYPDEIAVKAASVDDAMNQVVQSVHALRFKTSGLLDAYSNIDELCKRVRNSDRYAPVLEALFVSGRPLSVTELAQQTGFSESIAYQACYNMLREGWSPSPIKRTPDGKFSLTTTGEITMKRYAEKYGLSQARTQIETGKKSEETSLQAQESQPEK